MAENKWYVYTKCEEGNLVLETTIPGELLMGEEATGLCRHPELEGRQQDSLLAVHTSEDPLGDDGLLKSGVTVYINPHRSVWPATYTT